jgi:hypothetical protein
MSSEFPLMYCLKPTPHIRIVVLVNQGRTYALSGVSDADVDGWIANMQSCIGTKTAQTAIINNSFFFEV